MPETSSSERGPWEPGVVREGFPEEVSKRAQTERQEAECLGKEGAGVWAADRGVSLELTLTLGERGLWRRLSPDPRASWTDRGGSSRSREACVCCTRVTSSGDVTRGMPVTGEKLRNSVSLLHQLLLNFVAQNI